MAQPKIITRLLARLLRPAVEDIQRQQAAERAKVAGMFRAICVAEAQRMRAGRSPLTEARYQLFRGPR